MATVAKPFNSITQRFRLGAEVTEADDLAPHSFADLKTRSFIADKIEVSSSQSSFGKRSVAPTESSTE